MRSYVADVSTDQISFWALNKSTVLEIGNLLRDSNKMLRRTVHINIHGFSFFFFALGKVYTWGHFISMFISLRFFFYLIIRPHIRPNQLQNKNYSSLMSPRRHDQSWSSAKKEITSQTTVSVKGSRASGRGSTLYKFLVL